MPLLDVSDILFDPDFMDTMTLKRSTTTVGSNGRATSTVSTSTISGVVTSSGGDILTRLAEGRRRSGSIIVHTRTRLFAGLGNVDADIITYQGQDYTVTSVNDYSAYGAGFVAAECELVPLT